MKFFLISEGNINDELENERGTHFILADTKLSQNIILKTVEIKFLNIYRYKNIFVGLDNKGGVWEIYLNSLKPGDDSVQLLHRMSLPKDSLGGYPHWITVNGEIILVGGDGQTNQSCYHIQMNQHKIKIKHLDLTNGYQKLLKDLRRRTSSLDFRFISTTITLDATHYLVCSSEKRYFICKSHRRTDFQEMLDELGPIVSITNYGKKVYGFFLSEQGFYYGKLTCKKGLVTRKPNQIILENGGKFIDAIVLDEDLASFSE